MFKIHELKEIIKLVDQSSMQEFEFEHESTRLTMKKGQSIIEVQNAMAAQPLHLIPTSTEPIGTEPKSSNTPVHMEESAKEVDLTKENSIEPQLHKVVSPMVGTYYASVEPGAPPFVQVGDKIKGDTVVCIVEAMKLFNEIEAEVSGEVVRILAKNGQIVEYGQPLFLIKPE
jgi:acetyl-CoA carboxylase biotin carboxyl carrier protein